MSSELQQIQAMVDKISVQDAEIGRVLSVIIAYLAVRESMVTQAPSTRKGNRDNAN